MVDLTTTAINTILFLNDCGTVRQVVYVGQKECGDHYARNESGYLEYIVCCECYETEAEAKAAAKETLIGLLESTLNRAETLSARIAELDSDYPTPVVESVVTFTQEAF